MGDIVQFPKPEEGRFEFPPDDDVVVARERSLLLHCYDDGSDHLLVEETWDSCLKVTLELDGGDDQIDPQDMFVILNLDRAMELSAWIEDWAADA